MVVWVAVYGSAHLTVPQEADFTRGRVRVR